MIGLAPLPYEVTTIEFAEVPEPLNFIYCDVHTEPDFRFMVDPAVNVRL